MLAGALPREKIPWFPTVDYDICTGDQECFNFCKNNVFTWDEEKKHPIVASPYNCVVGCQACINVCPVQAISFPSKDELRETIKRLRMDLQAQQQSVSR